MPCTVECMVACIVIRAASEHQSRKAQPGACAGVILGSGIFTSTPFVAAHLAGWVLQLHCRLISLS